MNKIVGMHVTEKPRTGFSIQQVSNDPSIDISLAGGIRRSYFRTLIAEWKAYRQRTVRASGRNRSVTQRVGNQRQLRERLALLEELLGPLIPISVMRVDAKSRGGALVFGFEPEPVPVAPKADSVANLRAWLLLQPGRLLTYDVPVVVSGHAIDRIIQRGHIVDIPISKADIQAINAEFSDALPLAVLAIQVINEERSRYGDDAARAMQVVLPTAHGAFLAGWSDEREALVLRTFVDRQKLVESQLEALNQLQRFSDMTLAAPLMEWLAEGWYRVDMSQLVVDLGEAWRQYGWRFDVERLHPGLSDRAWREHPTQ